MSKVNKRGGLSFTLDPELEEYATERQWKLLEAWETHGTTRKAAKAIECNKSLITSAYKVVKQRAGQHGYGPDRDLVHKTAPGMRSRGTSIKYREDGSIIEYWNKTSIDGRGKDDPSVVVLPDAKTITKVSTQYGPDGSVMSQWVAEKPEAIAQLAAWEAAADYLCNKLPRVDPIDPPKIDFSDICEVYPIGDHHIGQLSWPRETGAPWDLHIAETLLAQCSQYLVNHAKASKYALIVFLGDWMHYDSYVPETPTGKNRLDPDSR